MLRNRPLITIAAILFSLFGQAQKRYPSGLNLRGADEELWNFGIMPFYHSFGLDYVLVKNDLKNFEEKLAQESSFGLRLTAEYTLSNSLNLRFEPGFILNKTFYGLKDSAIIGTQSDGISSDTPPVYKGVAEIQLPILFKYQSYRNANFNPFIVLGYTPSIKLLNSKERKDINDVIVGMNDHKISHSIEIGFGIDFYLTKGKLGIHARVLNELRNYDIKDVDDPIGNSNLVENIKWRGIILGISFETKDGWKLYAR